MTRWLHALVMALIGAVGIWPMATLADAIQLSPNYGINESQIGGIGDYNSASPNYSFKPSSDDGGSTLGDSFVGNSASTNFQTNAGFNTDEAPVLRLIVNTSAVSLGKLSLVAAVTATSTFDITDYTSYGYAVTLIGTPPKNGTHTLTALATDTASVNNTEQFGVNLVLNHSPANPVVGSADPLQVPSAAFSFGVAGDGVTGTFGTTRPYTIDGKYRFVSGETIASSPKTSGDTTYTMTYMANISPTTPGGAYTSGISVVATGQY